MNVFFDTNVLMDVLAKRRPFYDDAFALWSLAEHDRLQGSISAISFNNLYYLIERAANARKARRGMHMLRDTFTIIPLDSQILNQAIDAGIRDFEDAIQFFSAMRAGSTCLITRNPKHFPQGDIAIQTPAQFLAAHFAE